MTGGALENVVVTTFKCDVLLMFAGHTEDAHFNPTQPPLVIRGSCNSPLRNNFDLRGAGTPQHDRYALTEVTRRRRPLR